jgi:hypothetical protein
VNYYITLYYIIINTSSLTNKQCARNTTMASVTSERQVQELYIAYFGRPADASGLAYYANELDKGTKDVAEIALGFGGSAEAAPIVALDTDKYVEALYLQAFGRNYNAETDSTFWVDSIASGVYTKEMAMVEILNGASGNDATAVANKGKVAATFTTAQETNEKAYNVEVLTAAKALMSEVTAKAATLTTGTAAAEAAVDNSAPLTTAAAANRLYIIAKAELGAAEVAQATAVASAAMLASNHAFAQARITLSNHLMNESAKALAVAIASGDVAKIAAATAADTAAKADFVAKATAAHSASALHVAQGKVVKITFEATAAALSAADLAIAYGVAIDGGDPTAIAVAKSEQSAANADFDASYTLYTSHVSNLSKHVGVSRALYIANEAVSAAKAGGDPAVIAAANATRNEAVALRDALFVLKADPNGTIAASMVGGRTTPEPAVAAEALGKADEALAVAKTSGDPDIIAAANAARLVAVVAFRDAIIFRDAPSYLQGAGTFEQQISTINADAAAIAAAADPNGKIAAAAANAHVAKMAAEADAYKASRTQSQIAAEALGKADEAVSVAKTSGDPDIIAAANAARDVAVALRDATLYGDAPSAGGATFEEQISTINAAAAANVAAADPNDMRGAAIAADKAASDKLHAEHVAAAAADTVHIARQAAQKAAYEAANPKPPSVVAAEALGKADEALAAAKAGGDPDIIAAANASREAAVVLRDAALYLAVATNVTFHAEVLAVDALFAAAAASSASLEAVTEFDYSPEPDLFI